MAFVQALLRDTPLTPEEIAEQADPNFNWGALWNVLKGVLGADIPIPTGGPQIFNPLDPSNYSWGSPVQGLREDVAAQMSAGTYPARVVGGESARGSASPIIPPGPGPDFGAQQQAGYNYFINLDAQRAAATGSGGSGTGTGSGGISSYESAQRDLQRLFDQLELEQSLKDIKGRYRPELKQSAAKIAEQEGKAVKDSGIYTRLLREVVPSFRGAGRLAAVNLERARAAVAESDAKRRGEIDQSFASATGRARAMVLAVSGDSPEMVDALTQGMDDLNAFVDAGMAREAKGQQNLMEASAELARSAAYYGLASAQGEISQEREKTRITYENTINDMLAERQSMLDARKAALDSAREWAALEVAKRDAQWALADAQRGGGGSGTGRAGSGDFDPSYLDVTIDQYTGRALSYALTSSSIPMAQREEVMTAIQDMLATGITPQLLLQQSAAVLADPDSYSLAQRADAAWALSIGEANLSLLYDTGVDAQSDFEQGMLTGGGDQWRFRQAYNAAELGGAQDPTQYAIDLVNGLYGEPGAELREQGFIPPLPPAPTSGFHLGGR